MSNIPLTNVELYGEIWATIDGRPRNNVDASLVCNSTRVNKFGLDNTYCAGSTADDRLTNLRSEPYQLGKFRNYNHNYPGPPTGLLVEEISSGTIEANWNSVSGATSYDVRINVNNSGYGSAINVGTNTFYEDPLSYAPFDYICIQGRVTTSIGTSEWSTESCVLIIGDPI